jgi:hypothetical protein
MVPDFHAHEGLDERVLVFEEELLEVAAALDAVGQDHVVDHHVHQPLLLLQLTIRFTARNAHAPSHTHTTHTPHTYHPTHATE